MSNEYIQQLEGILKKQNSFILEMFNDRRMSDDLKEEYFLKYNKLKIKLPLNNK